MVKQIIKILLCFTVLPAISYAHEAWLMTPDQFKEWSLKPIPALFTQFNTVNVSLGLLTLLGMGIWYLLSVSRLG